MSQQVLTHIERVLTFAEVVSTDTACDVIKCLKRAYVHIVAQDIGGREASEGGKEGGREGRREGGREGGR